MNRIPIAFAFDNNLVLPACVCISSLLQHAASDTFYDIYILHAKSTCLRKEELEKIPVYYNNCRLQYREVGPVFDDAFEIRGITTPAYYRLLIPDLIPEYDKVIYSDVDVIFRSDLSLLYAEDLGQSYIAATYDLGLCLSKDGNEYLNSIEGLYEGDYIQSGFIVINSKQIRAHGVVKMFVQAAKMKLRYQDQDILNIVCRGNIKILPYMYNMTDQLFYYMEMEPKMIVGKYNNADQELAREKGTLHFNGAKPWKRYCVNFDIWWEYYRKSPFYDSRSYFDFFYQKIDEYDRLPLLKRIKILLRYFLYKK